MQFYHALVNLGFTIYCLSNPWWKLCLTKFATMEPCVRGDLCSAPPVRASVAQTPALVMRCSLRFRAPCSRGLPIHDWERAPAELGDFRRRVPQWRHAGHNWVPGTPELHPAAMVVRRGGPRSPRSAWAWARSLPRRGLLRVGWHGLWSAVWKRRVTRYPRPPWASPTSSVFRGLEFLPQHFAYLIPQRREHVTHRT